MLPLLLYPVNYLDYRNSTFSSNWHRFCLIRNIFQLVIMNPCAVNFLDGNHLRGNIWEHITYWTDDMVDLIRLHDLISESFFQSCHTTRGGTRNFVCRGGFCGSQGQCIFKKNEWLNIFFQSFVLQDFYSLKFKVGHGPGSLLFCSCLHQLS